MLSLILALVLISCRKNVGGIDAFQKTFLHQSGRNIVDSNNNIVYLRGITFGNQVWSDVEIPLTDHSEVDFERVKEMNMNVVRFFMNYKTFEDDATPFQYKQSGWDWIDKNIAWAKKNNIYLILNMHVPQGGYQSQGDGDALWNDVENQNRLTALWEAIASRYANEHQVAGYGLLNEPVPTNSIQQWQHLAQRIVDTIRSVDKNHILFIENANYIKGTTETDPDVNFPFISDKNLVYEFHFYDPLSYTHQLSEITDYKDGGTYPDDSIICFTDGSWYTATSNDPTLRPGNSDWTYFSGVKYKINDSKIKLGSAALVGQNVKGRVYFDDIVIKEYDPSGYFIRDVYSSSLDDFSGWSAWSSNNSGSSGLANEGHSNSKSIYIEKATADYNLSNYNELFIPKQNYFYQISGWMRGDNVAANAMCKLRIDFTTTDAVYTQNKQFLESILTKYADWAYQERVPIYMGEFGTGIYCFMNNKGGLQWVSDIVDIAKAKNINFTYHTYHGDKFGLYFGDESLPDPGTANKPLVELFKEKLSN